MTEGRILVIDDDPHILRAIQFAFEQAGFEVLLAPDADPGLEIVRDERPSLVITDLLLPRTDGFEIVQRIRSDPLARNTPIIILSARTHEADKLRGLELGADDYVTKPFSPTELVAKARAVLRRAAAYRERRRVPGVGGPFAVEGMERLAGLRFRDFVIGVGNRSAFEATRAAAESPGSRFNPLFLYGGNGLGKTHLVCALANEVYEADPGARILYVSSEVFSQQIVDAYRARQVEQFRREYVGADVLIVDDIQFLAVSPSLQTVAADILGAMHDNGKQIVICSDRKPEELQAIAAEISVRFGMGLVVEVDKPDADLRVRILKHKATQNNWPLDDSVLRYVADRVDSDVRTLEGIAKRLVAMKTFARMKLDTELIDRLLENLTSWDHRAEAAGAEAEPPGIETGGLGSQARLDAFDREFAGEVPLVRVLDQPERIARLIPQPHGRPVVILGMTGLLVSDTVEALVGRPDRGFAIPEGERWACFIHAASKRPQWIVLGTNRWTQGDELTLALERGAEPAFLVVLDSGQPDVLEARRLILSIPSSRGCAVVVLVSSIAASTTDATRMTIARSMRRLFRVGDEIPLVASGTISSSESRRWLDLALTRSRPR
ncbi:MAG: DnaA/Hda family protein [Candidatus Eisenbacteria bacterium]|jgi:DNA-binding response OmpR family regulator|nr:DnaA/Hda family protein [Candidatus Eisenbacteria bacterium]